MQLEVIFTSCPGTPGIPGGPWGPEQRQHREGQNGKVVVLENLNTDQNSNRTETCDLNSGGFPSMYLYIYTDI